MKQVAGLSCILAVVLIQGGCEQAPTEPTPAAETAGQEETAPAEPEVKEDPTPGKVVATGVFMGRGGKPMANARLLLAELIKDDQFVFVTAKLVDNVATATADREGQFQFTGFTPGLYTIVYQPAGTSGLLPQEIRIKTLWGNTDSITPGLKGFEVGKRRPFSKRPWGRRFSLLKGHTFFSEGQKMTIRNATVLYDQGAAHLEVRKGKLWTQELEDNSEIEFDAWSF